MERRELLARIFAILILLGLPGAIVSYQLWLRPELSSHLVIDIDAAVPEAGGFSPGTIQVDVDETVTLRFSAIDVSHGIAIGPGVNNDFGFIDPGEVKEITLSFDKPGTYTYYCNVWCSPNHWRMRGIIEVSDPANPDVLPEARPDAVITGLQEEGIDIDAERSNYLPVVGMQPSASRGATAIDILSIPLELNDESWRRRHMPTQALVALQEANTNEEIEVLVDAIAYLWADENDWPQPDNAANLYDRNCAACHGQSGGGNGPAVNSTAVAPASFSDPAYMFWMRSDVLYAKIRRGGMGTDMPNFGTLFTPEETWALVDYLWALQFSQNDTESTRGS
jgi:mono/diheme cytochrome c family protein/plastocyanin